MDKNLVNMIQTCYEMCDYIEKNNVIKEIMLLSLRDQLRQDLMHFVLYLSFTDDNYEAQERRFIKDYLDYDIYPARANFLRKDLKLIPEGFGSKLPFTLKYFVVADAGRKIPADQYQNRKARHLVATYRELGRVYIASHPVDDEQQLARLTAYMSMLDKFLGDYGLLIEGPADQFTAEEEIQTTEEILDELNSLVGLKKVKEDVNGLINLISVQKMREEMGIKTVSVN
ncbi:MAG: AAA family ATPase, partial [bacterium]